MSKNPRVVEAMYEDKIVFKSGREKIDNEEWKRALRQIRGKWKDHPVFKGMSTKEIVEYLRGPDSDV